MSNKRWKSFLWFSLTIGFMILIYFKSAEPYQQQDLRPALAARIPLSVLEKWLPHIEFQYDRDRISWQAPYDMLEFLIRKAAHVLEYAVLMFLWVNTLFSFHFKRTAALLFAAAVSLLYAVSDEWHQTFIPYRTGHAIDVAVDAIGIVIVMTIYFARSWRIRS